MIEEEVPEELRNEFIEKNLIVYGTYSRNPDLWVDEPPPEKVPELGIGRHGHGKHLFIEKWLREH